MQPLFDEEYQTKLVYLIATDEVKGLERYIQSDYLFVDSLTWAYDKILEMKRQFGLATAAALRAECRQANKLIDWSDRSKQYFDMLMGFMEDKATFTDRDYIVDNITKFIRKRELGAALSENAEAIEAGDWEGLKTALQLRQPEIIDATKNDTSVFTTENFSLYDTSGRVYTSFRPIDEYMDGLTRGEIFLLLADTNMGKSVWLAWLGGQIVRRGSRVVHVTLEMSKRLTTDRYFVSILDEDDEFRWADYRTVLDNDENAARFEDLRIKYDERYRDLLRIYKGKNLGFSLSDVNYILTERPCDVLILDYLDIMQPPVKVTDSGMIRIGQSQIMQGLRDLGEQHGAAIVTATQANRQSVGKRVVGKQMVAEDYGKIRIADNVLGMGADERDELAGQRIFTVIKARNSRKNDAFRYKVDFPRMRFQYLQDEALVVGESE